MVLHLKKDKRANGGSLALKISGPSEGRVSKLIIEGKVNTYILDAENPKHVSFLWLQNDSIHIY